MSDSPDIPTDAPVEAPAVSSKDARPAACGRCGYDTIGSASALCPECGFNLARTPLLRWADPGWLRTLETASRMIRVGAVAGAILFFLPTLIGPVEALLPTVLEDALQTIGRRAALAGLVVAAFGAFLLLMPDPHESDAGKRPLVALRWRLALLTIVAILLILGRWWFAMRVPPMILAAMSLGAFACGLAVAQGVGDVVRQLVARCDPSTRPDAKNAGKGGGCFVVVIVVMVILGILHVRRGPAGIAMLIDRTVQGFAVISALFVVWSLRKPLRAVVDEADRSPAKLST